MTRKNRQPESGTATSTFRLDRRRLLQGSAAFVALAACSPAATSPSPASPTSPASPPSVAVPRQGGRLTVLNGRGVSTLDPFFHTAGYPEIGPQVFDQTVDFKVDSGPEPMLAESWDETDTTLTLKLRRGVKFHNGREFTSQDVVDAIERAKDQSVGHQMFAAIDPVVESAEAIDPYTVRINYKSIVPEKFETLAQLQIIPKETWATVDSHPVGTGPFKFVKYDPGISVELERFAEHWRTDRPFLDAVTVQIMRDEQARAANMIARTGHIMPQVSGQEHDRLSKEPNLKGVRLERLSWEFLVLNCSRKPFDDQRVRQAMNYTIDRDKINELAFFGHLDVSQREYREGHWARNEEASQRYTFDLDKAKSLLVAAGYPEGFETSINVSVAVRPAWVQEAQIWQQDLAKIGVKLEIKDFETAVFYTEYNKMEWDTLTFAGGTGAFDPSSLVVTSAYRPIDNRARFDTQPLYEEYQRLFAEGLATLDLAVRTKAYRRIQEILAESGHIIVLGFSPDFSILDTRVEGFFQGHLSSVQYYADVWIAD